MAKLNEWGRLRKALYEHQVLMSRFAGKGGADFTDLPTSVAQVAEAADDVSEALGRGIKAPNDHAMLYMAAMQIVGMAFASRWVGVCQQIGEARALTKLNGTTPEVRVQK